MALITEFHPLEADKLLELSAQRCKDGWRLVQILGTNTENGVDLTYSFMKDDVIENFCIPSVKPEDPIPSVTGDFLVAFVFENEINELFGLSIKNIAIDFGGKLYRKSMDKPFTIISPEQKAAREKAAKAKAAAEAAAKAAAAKKAAAANTPKDPDAERAALEEKIKNMPPEAAAKVRAAMEAKAKREAAEAGKAGE